MERIARGHGLSVLRLDTRRDLVESQQRYATHGYQDVPLNEGPRARALVGKVRGLMAASAKALRPLSDR